MKLRRERKTPAKCKYRKECSRKTWQNIGKLEVKAHVHQKEVVVTHWNSLPDPLKIKIDHAEAVTLVRQVTNSDSKMCSEVNTGHGRVESSKISYDTIQEK